MQRKIWALINLGVGLLAVAAAYLVIVHRQDILDWWTLRSYSPPAAVQQLAEQDTMAGRGRDMFYVSAPSIDPSATFNQHCSSDGEKTIVLGCYTSDQHIYLYDVTDPRLNGVIQVTAAHEMLHAAYQRLDTTAKAQVDSWVQADVDRLKTTDDHLQSLITLYQQSEKGQVLNEMHSILGTEYANLSPQLENYYKQYFTDRSKVVGFANQYKAAFTAAQADIKKLEQQLNALKPQIDALTADVEQRKTELDQQTAELNSLRNDPAAYNAQVPSYNASVNAYNALVMQLKNLIAQYNSIVQQHNNEAAAQNDLYHSLDSHYQTVQ